MARDVDDKHDSISIDVDSVTSSEIDHDDDLRQHRQRAFEVAYKAREGYWRTVLAFVACVIAITTNAVVQAIVADQARNIQPLPDIFFIGSEVRWGEEVMNYVVAAIVIIAVVNTLMHQYRYIVARRILTIMAILYIMRAITLAATPLPPSYSMRTRTVMCDPRANQTTWALVWDRIIGKILSGGQAAGVCGDMLFSGHTMISTLCVLFTQKYTPRPHRLLLSVIMWTLLIATVVFLLISRSHYTVDILFAYWLSIGLFAVYHTFVHTRLSRRRDSQAYHLYITYIFHIMESDTPHGHLPNSYNLPIPLKGFNEVDIWLRAVTGAIERTHSRLQQIDSSVASTSQIVRAGPDTPLRHTRQSSAPSYSTPSR